MAAPSHFQSLFSCEKFAALRVRPHSPLARPYYKAVNYRSCDVIFFFQSPPFKMGLKKKKKKKTSADEISHLSAA